mgnify:CR=1 FL=1
MKKDKKSKQLSAVEVDSPDFSLPPFVSIKNIFVYLKINAKPNCKEEKIGVEEGELNVSISAEPKEGEANKAITKFLSKEFNLPKSSIVIEKGETSRTKLIRISSSNTLAFIKILKGFL